MARPVAARRLRLLVAVALALVTLASCAPSNRRYVRSNKTGTYLALPDRYETYSTGEVADFKEFNADTRERYPMMLLADGAPVPSIEHSWQTADYPVVDVTVRTLNVTEHDEFSLATLRNERVKVDEILENNPGALTILSGAKFLERKGGLRGYDLSYAVSLESGPFAARQIGLTDNATRTVWFLVVGCTVACFEQHRSEIDAIASSFTVKVT